MSVKVGMLQENWLQCLVGREGRRAGSPEQPCGTAGMIAVFFLCVCKRTMLCTTVEQF